MIKLQDLAAERGVTDRAIQKLLKKYEADLEGHFERKGPNGTWLDDAAANFIRGKMKQQPVAIIDAETMKKKADLEDKIQKLEDKIENLYGHLNQKDAFINNMYERFQEQQALIDTMTKERLLLEQSKEDEIINVREALTAHYSDEIDSLKEELDREKSRRLTLKERLTGHK